MFCDKIGWHRQHGSWRSTLAARYGPPPPHTVVHLAESGLRGGAGGDRPATIARTEPCLQAFVESLDALYKADMGSEPGQVRAVQQQTAPGSPPRAQLVRASNVGSSSPVTPSNVYPYTATAPAADQPDEGYESSSTTGDETSTDESASNADEHFLVGTHDVVPAGGLVPSVNEENEAVSHSLRVEALAEPRVDASSIVSARSDHSQVESCGAWDVEEHGVDSRGLEAEDALSSVAASELERGHWVPRDGFDTDALSSAAASELERGDWVPRRVPANGNFHAAGSDDGSASAEGGGDADNGRDYGYNGGNYDGAGNGDDGGDGGDDAGNGGGHGEGDSDRGTDDAGRAGSGDAEDGDANGANTTANNAGHGVHYNDDGVDIWEGSSLKRFADQGLGAGDLFIAGGLNILLWQALTELCLAREPEWQFMRF